MGEMSSNWIESFFLCDNNSAREVQRVSPNALKPEMSSWRRFHRRAVSSSFSFFLSFLLILSFSSSFFSFLFLLLPLLFFLLLLSLSSSPFSFFLSFLFLPLLSLSSSPFSFFFSFLFLFLYSLSSSFSSFFFFSFLFLLLLSFSSPFTFVFFFLFLFLLSSFSSFSFLFFLFLLLLSSFSFFLFLLSLLTCLTFKQERFCRDNVKCCHTAKEAAHQHFYLSQYTDISPTSPSAVPLKCSATKNHRLSCWYEPAGLGSLGLLPRSRPPRLAVKRGAVSKLDNRICYDGCERGERSVLLNDWRRDSYSKLCSWCT